MMLKKYKLPDSGQIPAELLSAIHKLIDTNWNKEELPHDWDEFVVISVHKKGDKIE
jgi:hypothetical protein